MVSVVVIAAVRGVVGRAVRGSPVGHPGAVCNGAHSANWIRWRARCKSRGCNRSGSNRPKSLTRCRESTAKDWSAVESAPWRREAWSPTGKAHVGTGEATAGTGHASVESTPLRKRSAGEPDDHNRDRSQTLHAYILRPFAKLGGTSLVWRPCVSDLIEFGILAE
jgi:hypothetical protein